jgi:hypothetical protein
VIDSFITLNSAAECANWSQLHDGVMGGISSGKLVFSDSDSAGLFSGIIRTEYNGGFASVRRSLSFAGAVLSAQGYDGVCLSAASADGVARSFSLLIKDKSCGSRGGMAYNYVAKFTATPSPSNVQADCIRS